MLVAALLPSTASAVVQLGALDADATDADLFQVTCSDDGSGPPASLRLSLLATTSGSPRLVSAQIQKSVRATSTTDPTTGDPTPSPIVSVDGGAGIYDVFVNKTDAGVETYELELDCMTGTGGTGVPTGIAVDGDEEPPAVPALPPAGWLALSAGLLLAARRWRR